MKFWITKENDMHPCDSWNDAYEFTLNRDTYSTIFSSLPTTWYHMNQLFIPPLYEDLFIIGLSIFSIDDCLEGYLLTAGQEKLKYLFLFLITSSGRVQKKKLSRHSDF